MSFRLEDYRTIPRHTRRSIILLITKTDVTLTFGRSITTHTFPHPRSSTIRQDQPYSAAAQTALLTRACGRSVIPVITYGKTSIIFGGPRSCEQRKRVKGRASGAGSGTVEPTTHSNSINSTTSGHTTGGGAVSTTGPVGRGVDHRTGLAGPSAVGAASAETLTDRTSDVRSVAGHTCLDQSVKSNV
jgi:hypothetical protein